MEIIGCSSLLAFAELLGSVMCASQRARGEGFWCATDFTEHTWFVALSEKWDQLCLFSVRRHQSSTVESSVTPVTPSRREAGSGCSTSRHLHHFLSFCLVWLTQACPTAVCSPRWSLQKIHFCFPNLMRDQEHTFPWFPETSLHSGSLQWDRVSAAAACLNPDLLSVVHSWIYLLRSVGFIIVSQL